LTVLDQSVPAHLEFIPQRAMISSHFDLLVEYYQTLEYMF
jgi:hypothetical protein